MTDDTATPNGRQERFDSTSLMTAIWTVLLTAAILLALAAATVIVSVPLATVFS